MQAKETKLQELIEGTKQYVVPLFQREYTWNTKEWKILWEDILELSKDKNPKNHFIGSIVSMPTVSVPEGVAKYMLIDGQQRLTTIFVILILLRDKSTDEEFSAEINELFVINKFKKGIDKYKLLPTQTNKDRETYQKLIDNESVDNNNQIIKAYQFFERKLRQSDISFEKIKKTITTNFSVVSIVLDPDDNPYLVFESLNAKGRPLSPADLIRNYFFMRIHSDKQNDIYLKYWKPMQDMLGEKLTDFIRHFLMRSTTTQIKQGNDVYYTLKDKVSQENVTDYLLELLRFSNYYNKLINPENEANILIRKYLLRLNRIEVTTAYPLLLNFYDKYSKSELSEEKFVEIFQILENFLIRRFVCNIPTNQLNKIFPSIYPALTSKSPDNLISGFKNILQTKGYPKDEEFKMRLKDGKLYGGGDRIRKTKLILESIEESFNHKEIISFDKVTIEHIMPQTLDEEWQKELGENWQLVYEIYKHNIGNLTLTGYNSELSNYSFKKKRDEYLQSHLDMNKYFENVEIWNESEIEKRAEYLSDIAVKIWSYFGTETSSNEQDIQGTTPRRLFVFMKWYKVSSWRDVLQQTLNTIIDLEPEKFDILLEQFPSYIGKDKSKFRAVRELDNGVFIEVNVSAKQVQKLCYQAIETIDLTADDWKVETISL